MRYVALLLGALMLSPSGASADPVQTGSTVVSSCGGQSYTAGQVKPDTLDTAGDRCVTDPNGSSAAVASPGSDATKAVAVQGVTGGKAVTVSQNPIASVRSTAGENSHQFCAAACTLYSLAVVSCPSPNWLLLYDATTAPADGAVTPAGYWPVNSSSGVSISWPAPLKLTTGATAVCSSAGPYTQTTVAASFWGQTQ